MTEDPVRLLSQGDDAFASSLLKSGRDGDRNAARSHKAVVLGAAGTAAVGSATLATAARLSSKGFFAGLGGKWLVGALLAIGGLGVGAALLWPRDAQQSPHDGATAPVSLAAAPASPQETAARGDSATASQRDPATASQRDPAAAAPSDAPAAPGDAPAASSDARVARSDTDLPGSAADAPAPAKASIAASARDSRPGAANTAATPAAAPAPSVTPGLTEEVAALRAAHEALGRGQSQKCLDAVNAYFAAFPNGRLSAEARYLRAEAMFTGGRRDEAAALARAMLAASPRSPYAARLHTIAGDP